MDEARLIALSRQGDVDSFNQLVEAYQRQVYNLALRMLGTVEAAQDATQEAFISAWRGIGRFRGGNFRAWLLSIVANACRDELRRRGRRPTTSLDALALEPESPSDDFARRLELGEVIDRGLSRLPHDQRLAIILSDVQGLSYEEMAQAMGCSLGTVRSRLSRARAQLKEYLLEQGELSPQEFRHNKWKREGGG
jgi:RNA polymerase sigma-70 factor (ECF subfamily)